MKALSLSLTHTSPKYFSALCKFGCESVLAEKPAAWVWQLVDPVTALTQNNARPTSWQHSGCTEHSKVCAHVYVCRVDMKLPDNVCVNIFQSGEEPHVSAGTTGECLLPCWTSLIFSFYFLEVHQARNSTDQDLKRINTTLLRKTEFAFNIRSVDIYFERSVDFYFEQLHSCYSFWEKICNSLKNDSAAGGEIHSFIVIKVLLHSHWRNVTSKQMFQNSAAKSKKKIKKSIENSQQLHISRQQKQNETWKEIQTGYNQVKMSDLYMNFNFIRRQESLQIILNSLIEFWSSNFL